MLRTALHLASRGLAVFPCRPRDKRPATARGCLDASTDAAIIEKWWREDAQRNVAIATGVVDGAAAAVFAIDIDVDDDTNGEASLKKLETEHGPLPATVESLTGGGGRHLLFRVPTGAVVKNTAGKLGPGLDTRGQGGFIIAPPSIHESGKRYCWSVDSADHFADAPRWLLDQVVAPSNGHAAVSSSAWRDLAIAGADEGTRDCSATRLTGYLMRRYIDPVVVHELAQCWNLVRCRPPLPPEDITRIVNSIAGKELQRRAQHGH